MKHKVYIGLLMAAAVALGSTLQTKITASNVAPGASGDPLVSQSYVDNKISQLMQLINNSGAGNNANAGTSSSSVSKQEIVDEVMSQLEFVKGQGAAMYTPVLAKKGQVVLGGEGTEIILRSGTGIGYCSGVNGIVNATDGSEIFNGTPVKKNNLLIVPKEDGRGVVVTSDEVWFIIKGKYMILN